MKILCVIDSLGSGGAQRQLVELAIGFKEKGNEVSFLVYHELNFYNETLEKEQISVTCIKESHYLKRLFKMRRYIRAGGFDAVLSFLEAANFICEIAGLPKRKWRLVVGERSANPNIMKSWKLRMYRWFHLLADFVVANSHENMKMVRRINPLLSDKKCKVIYNIIDTTKWFPSSTYEPLKEKKLNMVVAAGHRYLKNLDGLIEAVKLLDEKDKRILKIDWYGDVEDNSKEDGLNKISYYQLNDIFSFYPATHQIYSKIQMADVVGLFSFYEGFPNVLSEGMACGKTVIGPRVSDIPFILSNIPQLLFDPYDVNSIYCTLKYLLQLSVISLEYYGHSNLEFANKTFNSNQIIQEYILLFKA